MAYEYISRYTSPNQNARPNGSRSIRSITIHHWGARGQKFQNVVNYLCRRGSPNPTSAHYVVEAGKVACIVSPNARAWHAGNTYGNDTSIGIECRPEATEGDYRTVAELVRNLRRVYGNLPLFRHSHWKPTACPGVWDLSKIDRLSRLPEPTPPKEDDVALTAAEIAKIADEIWTRPVPSPTGGNITVGQAIAQTLAVAHALPREVWRFKNPALEAGDAYQILRDVRDDVEVLLQKHDGPGGDA